MRSRIAKWWIVAACGVALTLCQAALPCQDHPHPDAPRIVVVPIEGTIDITTVRLVQRAVSHARGIAASRLVLAIDTPGGRIDAMQEIQIAVDGLRGGGVRTSAWIARDALSAGAYLALCCDDLFMAPEARLGAITPVVAGPGGTMQIPEDDARAKALSAMRADIHTLMAARQSDGRVDEPRRSDGRPAARPDLRGADRGRDGLQRTVILDEAALDKLAREGTKVIAQHVLGEAPLTLTGAEALRFRVRRRAPSEPLEC